MLLNLASKCSVWGKEYKFYCKYTFIDEYSLLCYLEATGKRLFSFPNLYMHIID